MYISASSICIRLWHTPIQLYTFAEVASELLLPEPVVCAPDVVPDQQLNYVNVVDSVENESF